jgi:4'-phosphopantetheinyl transferase
MLEPHEIDLWYARLSVTPERLRSLKERLAPDEKARAARFVLDIHRDAFIASRGILRSILSKYLETPPAEIVFAYGERGKPCVTGSPICFNLSHSGAMAAYAVARAATIGIDIEQIRETAGLEQIARRMFAAEETEELIGGDPAHRLNAFYHCWTRKEAYIKAIGDGLGIPLGSFQVTLSPDVPAAIVQIDGSAAKGAEWSLFDLAPSGGYAGALAVHGTGWKIARTVTL